MAALKAARDKAASVTQAAVEYAKDRIMMGAERKSAFITEESRRLTAYHEGGHALVAMLTRGAMPVHKATIMPRGQALGMVMQLPEKDDKSMTRRQLLAMLDVCMGGRVAEELIFGGDDVTTGASHDLSSATRIAKAMVTQYGFSERGGTQGPRCAPRPLCAAWKCGLGGRTAHPQPPRILYPAPRCCGVPRQRTHCALHKRAALFGIQRCRPCPCAVSSASCGPPAPQHLQSAAPWFMLCPAP